MQKDYQITLKWLPTLFIPLTSDIVFQDGCAYSILYCIIIIVIGLERALHLLRLWNVDWNGLIVWV